MKPSLKNIIKILLVVYLVALLVLAVAPFGGLSTSLTKVTVLTLRLDYLLHALAFMPLVPLWTLVWKDHPWWLIIILSLLIAAAVEGSHYYIPYRAYNVNDLVGNVAGALLGAAIAAVFSLKTHPLFHKS